MKQLNYLNISENRIDTEGAKYIGGLSEFTELNISSSLVCDEGAATCI